jgi:hypothetical protein
MRRELRRDPTTEELRERLGYGGPKLDLMPELLGFITHVLLIAVMAWWLGYFL